MSNYLVLLLNYYWRDADSPTYNGFENFIKIHNIEHLKYQFPIWKLSVKDEVDLSVKEKLKKSLNEFKNRNRYKINFCLRTISSSNSLASFFKIGKNEEISETIYSSLLLTNVKVRNINKIDEFNAMMELLDELFKLCKKFYLTCYIKKNWFKNYEKYYEEKFKKIVEFFIENIIREHIDDRIKLSVDRLKSFESF